MAKRIFDVFFSALALIIFSWIILFFWILSTIDTRSNGFFSQIRIGQFGNKFRIYKLKTINNSNNTISVLGLFLRKYKIDELPQIWNVFIGNMSFVGPRPDLPGYYDKLEGENRNILELKPGITSEASIKYYNEEEILKQHDNALLYNDTVIFPDKVKMNLDYYYNRNLLVDIKIIIKTIF